MISEERLLQIIYSSHISEKVSSIVKKSNTIVLKVEKNANKKEIKIAVPELFQVKVKSVNTLIVKGKIKNHGKQFNHRNNWKKAYVILKKGQNLDFMSAVE